MIVLVRRNKRLSVCLALPANAPAPSIDVDKLSL
jgi:hypothetical protein